jgi:hypothetical protein
MGDAGGQILPPGGRGCGGSRVVGVTDLHESPETEVGPELIATHYLTSVEDVVEHLRAASQLGLGARVTTYLEQDEDGEGLAERWEFELLTGSPVHNEEPTGSEE